MTVRSAGTIACVALACAVSAYAQAPKPAQPDVASRNDAVRSELPFSDRQDFDDVMRGFVATVPDGAYSASYRIVSADTHVVTAALTMLVDRGWLAEMRTDNSMPGRPTVVYRVNPRALTR